MLKSASVALCCLLYVSGPARSQHLAWWVTWSIRPTGTEVEGVPVRELDPSWRHASVIRPSDISAVAKRAGERPEDHGVAFVVDADLDGDSQDERAVVGVFETTQGEIGRFLLILNGVKGTKTWTKKTLFSLADSTPFSAVDLQSGTLRWLGCLECDDVCAVVRSGDGFRLQCELAERPASFLLGRRPASVHSGDIGEAVVMVDCPVCGHEWSTPAPGVVIKPRAT